MKVVYPKFADRAIVADPKPAQTEAAERCASRIDALFEQTKLAAEARDSPLLESILRELTILNDVQSYLADSKNSVEPVRAIIEFLDGDLDRPPCVFPMAGSLEADNRVCREIERRWSQHER